MFDVVSTSSVASWSMNSYCPARGVGPQSPADRDFRPGFATELMLKGRHLSQQAAVDVTAATPLGRHAADMYASSGSVAAGRIAALIDAPGNLFDPVLLAGQAHDMQGDMLGVGPPIKGLSRVARPANEALAGC